MLQLLLAAQADDEMVDTRFYSLRHIPPTLWRRRGGITLIFRHQLQPGRAPAIFNDSCFILQIAVRDRKQEASTKAPGRRLYMELAV